MELINVSENRYCFNGVVKYWKPTLKTVKIDGLFYSNTAYEDVVVSVDEFKNTHTFNDYEFNFELIDYKIIIEDVIQDTFSKTAPCLLYSENDIVNLICFAFEKGILDNRIKNVFTTKEIDYFRYDYKNDWEHILESFTVRIPLFSYGFNNHVGYEISIETLFECNTDLIPISLKEIFKYHGIDLNKMKSIETLLKLINKKLMNYDTSK